MARCKSKKSSRHSINTFGQEIALKISGIFFIFYRYDVWCNDFFFLFGFLSIAFHSFENQLPLLPSHEKNLHCPYLEEGGAAVGKWSKKQKQLLPPPPKMKTTEAARYGNWHISRTLETKKNAYRGDHAINEFSHFLKK